MLSSDGAIENGLAISSTGRLYIWENTTAGLQYSDDRGASWVALGTSFAARFRSLALDPFTSSDLLSVHSPSGPDPGGVYRNATRLASAPTTYAVRLVPNPVASGWIHLSNGTYSNDGGTAWFTTNAAYVFDDIDATGAGYRVRASGSDTVLEKTASMTSPAWSTLRTFSSLPCCTLSHVRVVANTIVVSVNGISFLSTNGGATFTRVTVDTMEQPALRFFSMSAGSLTRAYAVTGRNNQALDPGWVYVTSDGGTTWTPTFDMMPSYGTMSLTSYPRVLASRIDPNVAHVRAENWNSTYEGRHFATENAFASIFPVTQSSAGCYSWTSIMALSPTSPRTAYCLGWSQVERTTNLSSWTLTPAGTQPSSWFVWWPWDDGIVSPGDDNIILYGAHDGRLYSYDFANPTQTSVEINSRLPIADPPAGISAHRIGPGNHQIRVVSRTGLVALSTNNGATFSVVNAIGTLASSSQRILTTSPGDPDFLVTAPRDSTASPAFSRDGGRNWTALPLSQSCSHAGIAISNRRVMFACASATNSLEIHLGDITPEPLSLPAMASLVTSSEAISNALTVNGVDIPTPVFVAPLTASTGGPLWFRKNGGEWANRLLVSSADTLEVMMLAPSTSHTGASAPFAIGSRNYFFNIRTTSSEPPVQEAGPCPSSAAGYASAPFMESRIACHCLAAATASGTVQGTDVYSSSSGMCRAAVHAGRISTVGGRVILRMLRGGNAYTASNRNGVTSTSAASSSWAFDFN